MSRRTALEPPTFHTLNRAALGALFAAAAWACTPGAPRPTAETPAAGRAAAAAPHLIEELGGHHHPISTRSELAQRYFDQGLVLTFGFNHEAAVRAFEQARQLDPACAMCAWGEALALGPHINAPMGPDAGRRAYAAVTQAVRLAEAATPRERAYIAALAQRYAPEPSEDRSQLDLAYANAMREVRLADPADADAATLAAEALMGLSPWNYWTEEAAPREHTQEILDVLEAVMAAHPNHVGANHYYIHAVEEHYPERGVPAAERLGTLVPDAGHLVHMPSHIFWRVGRYDDALEINRRASAADEQFFSWCAPGPFYRAAYYPHNLHFLWAAAAAEGRSQLALSSARRLETATRAQLEAWEFLEEFVAIPSFTLARFGQWDALLGAPRPAANRRYLTGVWHYTRGLALVRTGQLEAAAAELSQLAALTQEPAVEALVLSGGVASASQLLGIGSAHLEGELAAARGANADAIAALERAVERQDAVSYMEPPPWYFPVRQALGAVLLDAGQAKRAEATYRRDLEQYPSNGWSLFGLAASLRAQGRDADANWASQGFANAWARADVELRASRF